ncbi:MAG TPA: 3-hydroxyacyl-ACP dehydratase FabZ [Bacillota bacterium]
MLAVNEIKEQLPHRFPFLLVDRIITIEKGHKAIGIKNITANDFFCRQEYFNDEIMFPGSLQVEVIAQLAAFVVMGLEVAKSKMPLLASINKARFRRIIRPGDQLRIEVSLKRLKAGIGKFTAHTYIKDELAGEVEFTCVTAE